MKDDALVVEEAQKLLPDCDWIVDLYDLMMVWVSPKAQTISGYTKEEVLKMHNLDFAGPEYSEERLRRELAGRITRGSGMDQYVIETKNGNIKLDFEYRAFKYEGGEYMAGRIIKTESV